MAERKVLLMQGNEACAEGAIAAGVRFFAGYPITPSTEIAEILSERLPQVGGKFIQMEDEIASMAAVVGASLTGVKAMTATSGPGFSLKQENLGFASLTEVPCVVVNVQRMGPSTGLPTSPAQGDLMQARWGTHGDHPVVVLSPGSVSEAYTLTVKAFNIAEALRVPVIFLMDETVGHMREKVVIPDPATLEIVQRKKPTVTRDKYLPYGTADGDVPAMADFGSGYRWHVTGLLHNEKGYPIGPGKGSEDLITRLCNKVEKRVEELTMVEEVLMDDADVAIVSFGGTARSCINAAHELRAQGVRAGVIRLITVWPFPEQVIAKAASRVKAFVVPEMNLGQLALEVERSAHGKAPVHKLSRVDGELITPNQIIAAAKGV
ncbi:MAG: 2-oxoacid:acceptor oxidoreductase subunit alpha [Chloroflexota bacterium]